MKKYTTYDYVLFAATCIYIAELVRRLLNNEDVIYNIGFLLLLIYVSKFRKVKL